MINPLLSILIPTYNRCLLLEETLTSILKQGDELQQVEVLISNDCSQDNTQNFLDLFKEKNSSLDIRIYHHTKNLGGPGNWKFLLEQAKGEFVYLLSDDDWIHPLFLKEYFSVINRYLDVDIIYSAMDYRDEKMQSLSISQISSVPGLVGGVDRVRNQLVANHMVMSSMYRRKTLLQAGGWQEKYGTCLDGAAFALAGLRARSTYFIDQPLFLFRVGQQTWSSFSVEKQKKHYHWFRLIIDDVLDFLNKAHPEQVEYFYACYAAHAQGVLNMLDIKFLNKNLSQKELRGLLRELSQVFPECRKLSSFYKMQLVSWLGSSWLVFLRKLLNKPDIKNSSVFEVRQPMKGGS